MLKPISYEYDNTDVESLDIVGQHARLRAKHENCIEEYFNWSVWDWEHAQACDRFYLVRVGEGNTGIVMKGVLSSEPFEAEDWSGKGRQVFYMDMEPDIIINPDKAPSSPLPSCSATCRALCGTRDTRAKSWSPSWPTCSRTSGTSTSTRTRPCLKTLRRPCAPAAARHFYKSSPTR